MIHSMLAKNEVSKLSNSKQMYSSKYVYQTVMKFASQYVSKWTIKSHYQEILSLLIRIVKFPMKKFQILSIIKNYQVCYSIATKCLKQSVSKYAT